MRLYTRYSEHRITTVDTSDELAASILDWCRTVLLVIELAQGMRVYYLFGNRIYIGRSRR